jgi:uncharacterized protein (TIGR03435 family)
MLMKLQDEIAVTGFSHQGKNVSRATLAFVLAGILGAQSPAPRLEFEAASIKPNVDGTPYVFNGMKSPGMYSAENQTLRNLIQEAYGIPGGRRSWLPFYTAAGMGMPILGGPKWIGSDRYDITAKWTPTLQSMEKSQAEMELRLRLLLESRFQVKVHRETRNLPVYEMTIATPGKLTQGSCIAFDPANPQASGGMHYCGASTEGRKGLDWTLEGTGMKMAELANTLSYLIGDRFVVDKTGYTGSFDVHLRWTPGSGETGATWAPASPDDVGISVFSVLQERLGLRLKATKGPVEVLVVDRAERPSEN